MGESENQPVDLSRFLLDQKGDRVAGPNSRPAGDRRREVPGISRRLWLFLGQRREQRLFSLGRGIRVDQRCKTRAKIPARNQGNQYRRTAPPLACADRVRGFKTDPQADRCFFAEPEGWTEAPELRYLSNQRAQEGGPPYRQIHA